MRFISVISMRIHVARTGTSTPRSCSTASAKANSLNSGEA